MTRWFLSACLLTAGLAGGFVAERALHGQNAVAVAIPKELTSYREVVKKVLPAVVSVEMHSRQQAQRAKPAVPRRSPELDDPRLPEEARKFLEEFGRLPQVPRNPGEDAPRGGFGSGFLVDPSGVILTNFHVVDGATQVEVTLMDGRKFASNDIKGDRKTDLAIIRIDTKKEALPFLEMGDSDSMEIGDRVLAVGAPFGLTGSVTSGIISAKGRNGLHMNLYEDFVQTDAAINPGNSGGPLVNLEGKVIGINSAIKSHSGGFQGVGLAIASNLAKNVQKQLLEKGAVQRGYLGVQIKDLDPEIAARLGVKDKKGVVVAQVFDGAPAAKSGLQAGDVITGIAGSPVKNSHDLQRIVAGLPLNKSIDVEVLRDGKSQVMKITIEEQPDVFGTAVAPSPRSPRRNPDSIDMDKLGIEVTDMTAEMAGQLGFKETDEGVVITKVDPSSLGGRAGLQRGMLVVKADKHVVKSASAFRELIEKASLTDGVLLQVRSPRGGLDYVMLKEDAAKK